MKALVLHSIPSPIRLLRKFCGKLCYALSVKTLAYDPFMNEVSTGLVPVSYSEAAEIFKANGNLTKRRRNAAARQ